MVNEHRTTTSQELFTHHLFDYYYHQYLYMCTDLVMCFLFS